MLYEFKQTGEIETGSVRVHSRLVTAPLGGVFLRSRNVTYRCHLRYRRGKEEGIIGGKSSETVVERIALAIIAHLTAESTPLPLP
ncbi:hypothetical protein MATL_G00231320 [Megalops atlanticus]|uniref:Uncharacterized protein n=1 Tax=Megalops atlanticus TaxID=7932 RepID=A0A9D3T2C3_MEGAT|nr:hypothetical protein MATL_G00231320 [Megalops atlanticus]